MVPAAKLGMRQLTLLPDRLQVPWSDVTDTKVTPLVQLSLMVTPVAAMALLSLMCNVYVNRLPTGEGSAESVWVMDKLAGAGGPCTIE